MRDQVRQLQAHGIAAAALNSSNSGEDNSAIEAGLRRRRYRLLYVAPERLALPDTPDLLRDAGANVFAIDEAHCGCNGGMISGPNIWASPRRREQSAIFK